MAFELGLIDMSDAMSVVKQYEVPRIPGVFLRYPGATEYMNHDDLTAAAVLNERYASSILAFANASDWEWPQAGNLSRILDFVPTILASAGISIPIWEQFACLIAWVANCFERKEETSGKQLIWLKVRACYGKGFVSDLAIAIWRWRMNRIYPGGLQEMLGIYYKPDRESGETHPIVNAAKNHEF
jgi:hypothetical protein